MSTVSHSLTVLSHESPAMKTENTTLSAGNVLLCVAVLSRFLVCLRAFHTAQAAGCEGTVRETSAASGNPVLLCV